MRLPTQKMMPISVLALVVGALSLGGTTYDFAPVAKGDRVTSIADCRDNSAGAEETCRRSNLPFLITEAIEIGPGLSMAGQTAF